MQAPWKKQLQRCRSMGAAVLWAANEQFPFSFGQSSYTGWSTSPSWDCWKSSTIGCTGAAPTSLWISCTRNNASTRSMRSNRLAWWIRWRTHPLPGIQLNYEAVSVNSVFDLVQFNRKENVKVLVINHTHTFSCIVSFFSGSSISNVIYFWPKMFKTGPLNVLFLFVVLFWGNRFDF